ncbi:MAG: CvpA family protein [Rikenellaceae bacterium]
MNIFDGVILLILGFSLYSGFRSGMVLQLLSVVGIVVAIWLASLFGGSLGIGGSSGEIWGFLIIFFAVAIGATMLSQMIRKVVRFIGLGAVDNILGMVLSSAKYLLVMSVLFSAFIGFNNDYKILSKDNLKSSHLFYPIASLSKYLTFGEWFEQAGLGDLYDGVVDSVNSFSKDQKGKKWDTKEL